MADETSLVKSPYKKTAFTDEQLVEFLKCADPITGPQYFMDNFFHIQHPIRGKIERAREIEEESESERGRGREGGRAR